MIELDFEKFKKKEEKLDFEQFKPIKEKEELDWTIFKPPEVGVGADVSTKTMQDIAKIMPKAEEAKKTMGLEYIPAKVISGLVERPLAAMGEPISWALEKGFRALGLGEMADTQKEVTELYKKPPITEKVEQQTAYLRQEAYKKSSVKGIGFDITEGVTQLINLLTQVAVTKKLPGLQGKDIFSHFKVMAGHAIATTPGDLPERFQAAVYRMAYSMTPFIANWTGATGLTAVATDTALNIFLTSPSYQKAWKEAENPEEFFQMAIPQLVMDIGMAWNTRGLPANQARIMQEKYLKLENRVIKMKADEFAETSQKIAEKTKEEIAIAEKYDIPLEKVHTTKLGKADVTTEKVTEETISKLEKKWGKETELTKEKVLEKVIPTTGKVSKIAKSIEAKSIEQGLTEGFGHLAEYTPIVIKEQAQRASNLIDTDINGARRIIRGEKPLPEGLKGTALITAMEKYIKNTADGELASELANSPLVSGTSAAAQELRLAAERDPISPVKGIQDVNKILDETAKKRLPGKILGKAKADTVSKIKNSIKSANTTQSWKAFIESIRC